jgi:hypothetical protein
MKHSISITLLVLCFCVLPAAAVIQEVTLKGTISAISRENNTLTIADPAQYGCYYPATGIPVCSFTPIDSIPRVGSVPADSAFSVFAVGDSVVAKSLGGMGGRWITLAKLSGTADSGDTVTDIIGDPTSIPTPLAGDYSIDLSTEPDCTTCSGTICTAKTAYVKIMSGNTLALAQDLEPGHAMTYNGRNDGSGVSVTFMKGQASSLSCAGMERGMTGPQAISVYIVHVVPPIGSGGQAVQTSSATPTEVTMPSDARPIPTKSGMLPFAAIGALVLVAILGYSHRE